MPPRVVLPKISAIRAADGVRCLPSGAEGRRRTGAQQSGGAARQGSTRLCRRAAAGPHPARVAGAGAARIGDRDRDRRLRRVARRGDDDRISRSAPVAPPTTSPPLQVALVNAKSASKPAKADILAQANLDGGGNTEKDRRAKTPLPVLPRETPRQNVAVASPRTDAQENTTREMLTQLKAAVLIPTPEPKPLEELDRTESPTANEMMQRTLEAMRLEASDRARPGRVSEDSAAQASSVRRPRNTASRAMSKTGG